MSGQRLRRQARDRPVHGVDMTFSAPKSVSLVYFLGGEQARAAVPSDWMEITEWSGFEKVGPSAKPPTMRLAFQDDRRLLYRQGLPGSPDGAGDYIGDGRPGPGEDPFGANEPEAIAALNTIYQRIGEAAGTKPRPAVRFIVLGTAPERRRVLLLGQAR